MEIAFPGKRVLVTGAARGIGRAIVHAFAADRAEVHAVDFESELVRETAATAELPVEAHCLDVTDSGAVDALVARIGTVDIAVHAAGGVRGRIAGPWRMSPTPTGAPYRR